MDSDAQETESSESGGISIGGLTPEKMTKRLNTFTTILGSTQLTTQEANDLLEAIARLRLMVQTRVRLPDPDPVPQ